MPATNPGTLSIRYLSRKLAIAGYYFLDALPYLGHAGVPFLFPRSGSLALRQPVSPNVFTLNAGYYNEGAALVRYLVEEKKIKDICIFTPQHYALGDEGRKAVNEALASFSLQ